jgi:hypothetical protein
MEIALSIFTANANRVSHSATARDRSQVAIQVALKESTGLCSVCLRDGDLREKRATKTAPGYPSGYPGDRVRI